MLNAEQITDKLLAFAIQKQTSTLQISFAGLSRLAGQEIDVDTIRQIGGYAFKNGLLKRLEPATKENGWVSVWEITDPDTLASIHLQPVPEVIQKEEVVLENVCSAHGVSNCKSCLFREAVDTDRNERSKLSLSEKQRVTQVVNDLILQWFPKCPAHSPSRDSQNKFIPCPHCHAKSPVTADNILL